METFHLLCHPESPTRYVRAVTVDVARDGDVLALIYRVDCPVHLLDLPETKPGERTDGLWQHTCFEAFVRSDEGGYAEFNFAPSGQWAAYDFDGYRSGMRPRPLIQPLIAVEADDTQFPLSVKFEASGLSGALALSAVVEEGDGIKSYWALNHAPGRPDFHHDACFAATLPAPKPA